MKILYLSPENTVGLLSIWKKIHESNGHEMKFITMYRSKQKFDDGICLNLPLINTSNQYINARNKYYKITRGPLGNQETWGGKSIYNSQNWIEKIYFPFRDVLWKPKVEKYIIKNDLFNYDVYHFEWGMDLYRNFSFAKRLKKMGKPIIAHYHGQDIRTRGVFADMDQLAALSLTSEIDLISIYSKLNYLPLPFVFPAERPDFKISGKIKICHSTTNRYYKGSEIIIPICERLANNNKNVEFILIENKSHAETMQIKKGCDINIDQICNRGGWGYGMNSVEAMSMGLCVVSEINDSVKSVIGDSPFVDINQDSIYEKINELVGNRKKIVELKEYAYEWGFNNHGAQGVSNKLYKFYQRIL